MSNIHQLTVSSRTRPAVPGMLADIGRANDVDVFWNVNPQADEVWDLVIDTATNSEEYSVFLDDPEIEVSYTADSSTSKIEISDGLADAWNESPICRGMATAVADGTDTVTFTGIYPGVAFGMTEGENAAKMTLTNTTDAAEADAVPFGRAIVSLDYATDEDMPHGILAKSSVLSARVTTLTVTYAAGEIYTVGLTVEGVRYSVNVAADTDDDTTAAAINTAINAMMPSTTVIGTVATNVVTLTAELAGKWFDVDLGLVSGTTARLVKSDTTNTPACDLNQVIAGVSLWTTDEEVATVEGDSTGYKANRGVSAVTRGAVFVELDNDTTVTNRSPVYVELDGTGSNAGKFYTSTSSTRVKLDSKLARWRRVADSASGADVGMLVVDLAA